MSSAAVKIHLTPQQYLALERKTEARHEYRAGVMSAMSGASRQHNLIAGNLFCDICTQLRYCQCEVYASRMRVLVGPTGLYTYPDVVAVCGEPRFEDREVDTLLNPMVIIEVLSPRPRRTIGASNSATTGGWSRCGSMYSSPRTRCASSGTPGRATSGSSPN